MTWVWVSSRCWWWPGKPGMLQSMGSQRVRHDWATELNWATWAQSESGVTTRAVGGRRAEEGSSQEEKAWSTLLLPDCIPCHGHCPAVDTGLFQKCKPERVPVLVNVCVAQVPASWNDTKALVRDWALPKMHVLKPHTVKYGRMWLLKDRSLKRCLSYKWNGAKNGLVPQLYMTLCDPMNCSLPGSSVHGISQARILEWVAISSSKGSSWPRDQTRVSYIGRQVLYHCSTCETHNPIWLVSLWEEEIRTQREAQEGMCTWEKPCEDAGTWHLSASLAAGWMTLLTPWSWTFPSRVMREYVSVV